MSRSRDDRQKDLLRPALDQIIAMGHPLVRPAHQIDWGFLDRRLGVVYKAPDGHPPLARRPPDDPRSSQDASNRLKSECRPFFTADHESFAAL